MLTQAFRAAASLAPRPPVTYLRRDSRGASASAGGVYAGQAVETPRNFQDYLDLYESLVTVYRCASLIAGAVSHAKLRLYRAIGDDEREEIDRDSPLAVLFRKPNPVMSWRGILWRTIVAEELTGNSYWELARGKSGKGPVGEMWPLNPAAMKIIPDPRAGVLAYAYKPNQRTETFQPHEIFHVGYPDPNSDFYGISPLRAATKTLVSDKLLERATNAMLNNGTRLSGVLTVEPGVGQSEIDHVIEQFNALYNGVENWGKNLVIPGGRKWDQISMTPAEFEAIATRKWNREQILEVFGVWPIIYGIMDTSATRENATVQRKLFHELTVAPKATILADEITERLIPKLGIPGTEGVFAEFDFSELPVVREQALDDARANASLTGTGILTINEVRAVMGYDPVPYGNEWYGNSFALGVVASSTEPDETDEAEAIDAEVVEQPQLAATPTAPGRNVTVSQETALNGAQVTSALAIVQAVADRRLPRDSGLGQLQVFFNLSTEEAALIMGSVGTDAFQPVAEDEAASGNTAPTKADESAIAKATRDPFDEIISAGELDPDERVLLEMRSIFGSVVKTSAEATQADIGVDIGYNVETPELQAWLETKLIKFADSTWDTSAEKLRESLLEGRKAGESIQQLAKRVDTVFEGRKDNALAVARTEVGGSANKGAMAAFEDAGLTEHAWLSSRDEFVRESHVALEGERVKIGSLFSNGLEFPLDTAHGAPGDWVNCRCTVEPILPGGKARADSHTEEQRVALWKAFDKRATAAEKPVIRQWGRILDEQRKRVKAALAKYGG